MVAWLVMVKGCEAILYEQVRFRTRFTLFAHNAMLSNMPDSLLHQQLLKILLPESPHQPVVGVLFKEIRRWFRTRPGCERRYRIWTLQQIGCRRWYRTPLGCATTAIVATDVPLHQEWDLRTFGEPIACGATVNHRS
jgi:hypothetical protein